MKTSPLFKFVSSITRDIGFLSFTSFLPSKDTERPISDWERLTSDFLIKHKTPAIVNITALDDPQKQVLEYIRVYGMGPIRPNTIVMGIPENPQAFDQLYEPIAASISSKRNLLIVGHTNTECNYKNIDIWWDSQDRKTSEFMLLIALLLSRSPGWKKAIIHLKSAVLNEESRKSREEYFRQFMLKTRLPIDTEVLVLPSDSDNFSHFSKGADLVLTSLPSTPDDLRVRFKETKQFSQFVFCKNAGDVEFTSIFS